MTGEIAAVVSATGVDTKIYLKEKAYAKENRKNNPKSYRKKVQTASEFENAAENYIKGFNLISVVAAAAVFIFSFGEEKYGGVFEQFARALIPALTFAMVFIPAEIVSLIRLYFAAGAKTLVMSGKCVPKSLGVIEDLSAITAVCTDKRSLVCPGTLRVADCKTNNADMFLNVAALSCDCAKGTDVDDAIRAYAAQKGVADITGKLIKSYPFSKELRLGGNLWEINGARLICIKGTPENVFAVSNAEKLFSERETTQQFEEKGFTAIAAAYAVLDENTKIPENIIGINYNFIGLFAMEEQIRDFARPAVENCYNAGIKVIMITGGSPETAVVAANKIGMGNICVAEENYENPDRSAPEIEKAANIFANTEERRKIEIIETLKQRGEITAAFGVNSDDADILKSAQVGIFTRTPENFREGEVSGDSAALEAANLIVSGESGLSSFAGIVSEAKLIYTDIKNCLLVYASGSIAFLLFSALAFLVRREMFFAGSLIALIEVLFIPAACMFYFYGKNTERKKFAASKFLITGKIGGDYIVAVILRSAAVFFSMLFASLICTEPKSGAFISFTVNLVAMNWCYLADGTHILKLAGNPANKYAAAVSASMIILALVFVYMPFLNRIFGLSGISPLSCGACIIISAALQLPVRKLTEVLRDIKILIKGK